MKARVGVVFSAAGQSEFARREVLPAAAIVAALRAARRVDALSFSFFEEKKVTRDAL